MKQVILGTAGHIDHGKTALVKALTGIDCDRLKEEKERGITIDIGFAHLNLKSGIRVGIIDVPGHERFVKNMLAGAHGIDLVLLVIAADEGVMPQTREHMDIVTLLGVKKGIVALTKVDLVDDEWREMVVEEVRDFLKGTFLAQSPIVPVSSVTGLGLDELLNSIDGIAQEVAARPSGGLFRLPIDRVFTIKGFGTVVTGTMISGQVRVGEVVEVLPQGLEAKVRGLEVHGQDVEEVWAGARTAVNLQGVERTALKRGDILAHPGIFKPTKRIEVYIRHLKDSPRPLRRRAPVRFHVGTTEVMARVEPLDREELAPGEEGYATIRLEGPVTVSRGDRFVIRSYSPIITIGGGEVLNPSHRLVKVRADLDLLEVGDAEVVADLFARLSGYSGIDLKGLAGLSGLFPEELSRAVENLKGRGRLIELDGGGWIHSGPLDRLKGRVLEELSEHHRKNPLKEGMAREELRSKLPGEVDQKLLARVLEDMTGQGVVVTFRDYVKLAGHSVKLEEEELRLKEALDRTFIDSGLTPPLASELSERFQVPIDKIGDLLNLIVSDGKLVKVKDNLYFHKEVIEVLKARLIDFLKAHGEINPTQYKELTGASRKFTVPLMEYFDSIKVTIRVGDVRRLRAGG